MQIEQNRTSELEDKNLEIIRVKKDIELKILKSETLQESWDSIKKANIRLWVYQKEEKQQRVKERITENYPNLGKELDIQVQEANGTPDYLNAETPFPRHNEIVKSQRILKAARNKRQ